MSTHNASGKSHLAATILLVLGIALAGPGRPEGAPAGADLQEQQEEDMVPMVPAHGDGWVEFAPAPVYQSKNDFVTTTTKLKKTEEYACAVFSFREDGNMVSWPGTQPRGVYRVVTEGLLPQGLPGGTGLQCSTERKMILETELGGAIVDRKTKPARIKDMHLRLRNYDAEETTTCTVAGQVVRTETERNDGSKAKWWGINLRDWPLENGYSEVVGRFKYTLYVRKQTKK
jgi:hypothetical protein